MLDRWNSIQVNFFCHVPHAAFGAGGRAQGAPHAPGLAGGPAQRQGQGREQDIARLNKELEDKKQAYNDLRQVLLMPGASLFASLFPIPYVLPAHHHPASDYSIPA